MKLHKTLVEKLIVMYEVNSGWPEQRRLREALAKLNVTVYTQKNGNEVLVSTDDLQEQAKRKE
tara:strand:- start:252 stop:440 length:189 start_codon:yes stop_codon:yes gene_type:complete